MSEWKLVPVEMTDEMADVYAHWLSQAAASRCWAELLDAAPAAPLDFAAWLVALARSL